MRSPRETARKHTDWEHIHKTSVKKGFNAHDNRPEAAAINEMHLTTQHSARSLGQQKEFSEMLNTYPAPGIDGNTVIQSKASIAEDRAFPNTPDAQNSTGLPDPLKAGIEHLSGYSMNDVNVHYNSGKPLQIGAYAFAQGTEIHLAPGREKYLPHEAWHVVQQKQGRVKPKIQSKHGLEINNDQDLEHEADQKGTDALNDTVASVMNRTYAPPQKTGTTQDVIQGKWAGLELETQIPIFRDGERKDKIDGYAKPPEYQHENVSSVISDMLGERFEIHVDTPEKVNNSTTKLLDAPNPKILEIVTPPRPDTEGIAKDVKKVIAFVSPFNKPILISGNSWNIGWPTATSEYNNKSKDEINSSLELDAKSTQPLHLNGQVTFQNDIETLGDVERKDVDSELNYNNKDSTALLIQKLIASRGKFAEIILRFAPKTGRRSAEKLAIVSIKMLTDTFRLFEGSPSTIKNAVRHMFRNDLTNLHAYLVADGNGKAICRSISGTLQQTYSEMLPESLSVDASLKEKIRKGNSDTNAHIDAALRKLNFIGTDSPKVTTNQVLEWWTEAIEAMLTCSEKGVTGPLKGIKLLTELERDNKDEPMVVYEERNPFAIRGDAKSKPEEVTGTAMKYLGDFFQDHHFPGKVPLDQKALTPPKNKVIEKGPVMEHKEKALAPATATKNEAPKNETPLNDLLKAVQQAKTWETLIDAISKLPAGENLKFTVSWKIIQPWMEAYKDGFISMKMITKNTAENFIIGSNKVVARFEKEGGDNIIMEIQ